MDKIKNDLQKRTDYTTSAFDIHTANKNPFNQFEQWFAAAVEQCVPEVNAMTLSTANKDGKPSSRIVLLRHASEDGFTFFTNYNSHKAHDLENNPFAALNFFWPALEKQIRIEGKVKKVDATVSDHYFQSRPIESRIGAWASDQSHELKTREELENKIKSFTEKFGNTVPRPPHWGGYVLIPDYFEFWQGRPSRLHDRVAYVKATDLWNIKLLSP
jgi:pyridoxamine 5'-phosphate oxidase